MKIAVVEDNQTQREKLISVIKEYAHSKNFLVSIDSFEDGIQLVDTYQPKYDIVYLDIEMDIMDGMTAAKKIRQLDNKVLIVFVTNYVQFAIEGYSVNATDFLLKPINSFSFSSHFDKIYKLLSKQGNSSITVKTNNGFRRINVDDILYLESEGHSVHIHTINEVISLWDSLKNFENQLQDYNFFRCNNCYLVNLKFVDAIDKNHAVLSGHRLQISRPRKKDFLSALTNFLGEN